jgi:hypothetical protein
MMGEEPARVNVNPPSRHWRGRDYDWLRSSCSGALVVTRMLWEEVGGFDEGFVGWGFEDLAARLAFEAMAGHEMLRVYGALYHLFHDTSADHYPASPTVTANRERCDRYLAAQGDRERMREVLAGELDSV